MRYGVVRTRCVVVVRVLDVATGAPGAMVVVEESVRTSAPVESSEVEVEFLVTGTDGVDMLFVVVEVLVLRLSVIGAPATGTATGTTTAAGGVATTGVSLSLTEQAASGTMTMAARASERRTGDARM
jgi:hypothetical protein